MIILIDNYDSFTFNIFHYLSELGAKVKVFRNDKIKVEKIFELKPKAIVLSPGPKTPNEAGICLNLIKKNIDIPILGICLGHQSIAQSYGGSIIQCGKIMHGKIDKIIHNDHLLFRDIENVFEATRYHSLMVDDKKIPNEIDIIAKTKDNIIMAIAHKKKHIYGCQFHPESIGTKNGRKILKNFLNIIDYEF